MAPDEYVRQWLAEEYGDEVNESGDDRFQAVNITESEHSSDSEHQRSALKLPIFRTILVKTTALNITNNHEKSAKYST
jgi:hypothetical protein